MTQRSVASGESRTNAATPARPPAGEPPQTASGQQPKTAAGPEIVERPGPQHLGSVLLQWFAVHRRDLPWRVGRNPYRVWISEVMLQQTRVDTVVPYYNRFLETFPTVKALAAASEADVLQLWEGLGYYSRARNLHRAAQAVVERFGGELPRTVEQLRTLPGIGRYTAGAIASIAFNEPVAAVDGNVLRVIARLAGITDLITKAAVQRRIEQHVEAMIPSGRAALMTEALMELGALVCLPRTPLCARCPWRDECVANAKGIAAELPKRPERSRPPIVTGAVAVVRNGDTVLVTKRPAEGLLAGMWEFPWVETRDDERQKGGNPADDSAHVVADAGAGVELLRGALRERHGINVRVVGQLPPVRHVFSHLQWQLDVFECELVDELLDLQDEPSLHEPGSQRLGSYGPGSQRADGTVRETAASFARRATAAPEPKAGLDRKSSQDQNFVPIPDRGRRSNTKWVTAARLQQLPFGRAHRRIATAWLNGAEAASRTRLFAEN